MKSLFDKASDTTFYKVNRDLRLKDNVNNFVEIKSQNNLFYVDYSALTILTI